MGRAADWWLDGYDGAWDGAIIFDQLVASGLIAWDYEVCEYMYED